MSTVAPENGEHDDEAREAKPAGELVLVSACLLGRACRHDGRHNADQVLERRLAEEGLVALHFCPEEHGGLGTPRPPAWIERTSAAAVLDGRERVLTDAGRDVTAEFLAGAEGALALCRAHGIRRAFLKERSPSCGTCQTHAGGALVAGPGITTALLSRAGIRVEGIEGRRAAGGSAGPGPRDHHDVESEKG